MTIMPKSSPTIDIIVDALLAFGPMTAWEIANYNELQLNTVQTYLSLLKRKGAVQHHHRHWYIPREE